MENGYGLYGQGSSGWTSMRRNEEFQEEDVWGVFKERKDSEYSRVVTSRGRGGGTGSFKEPSIISKRLPTATRMIPKSCSNQNSTSQEPLILQHSAPLNIPDWSKIYGTNSKSTSKNPYDSDSDGDGNNNDGFRRSSWESEDEYEEEEGCVIPPHEWIAKKLARSQISSFSVCEGAGRTLKGRDLSRVRNAVLTKTGFLESKSNY